MEQELKYILRIDEIRMAVGEYVKNVTGAISEADTMLVGFDGIKGMDEKDLVATVITRRKK